jgi:hypothetical protein
MGQKNLFVNWHPAPLGHEIIGNQMAYYYLQLMVKALKQIVKAAKGGSEEALDSLATDMRTVGGAQPLPNNQHCHDYVCKFLEGDRPKCAYSFLPKAMGPDVGDWMVNKTAGGKKNWLNKGTGESICDQEMGRTCTALHQKHTAQGGHHKLRHHGQKKTSVCSPEWPENGQCDEGECVRHDEKCGYYDEKRGMYGQAGDHPLTFKVSALLTAHCSLLTAHCSLLTAHN